MKFIIALNLTAILYINVSDAVECSSDNWKPVPSLDPNRILGRWFAIKRYANDQHGKAHCLWHDLYKHPTKSHTVVESINLLFRNGTSNSKSSTTGDITSLDPGKKEGKVSVSMQNGAVAVKYVVAMDYDEYAFVMSCHDGIEYLWIYTRNLYPSAETMEKVNKIIEELHLDKSKLVESCVEVKVSDIF